ncbi:hypothetical protein IWW38_000697 [Coemansia aciculifera]|uniref:Uncharacterized protein n=1 Tax=Coemansia aciculifera TaxID=417176 RepID=A0ACC1MA73_9FUNG|nr:hypothetical protein IWW38_000697 [Coemansia aciculifera]
MPLQNPRIGNPPKKTQQQHGRGGGGPDVKVYRDRAAERREGGSGDYAESERLLGHLDKSDRLAAYEQSKYLGGDVARTHLVQGLDFLLLEKTRAGGSGSALETAADSHWESEVDRLLFTPAATISDAAQLQPQIAADEASTPVGKQVLAALQRICQLRRSKKQEIVSANDLFMPGRMCFEIGFAANGAVRSTTRIRNQDEVLLANCNDNSSSSDRLVLTKVVAAIAAGRHRRNEAKSVQKQSADVPIEAADIVKATDVGVDHLEEEEDIFADAGVDYHISDNEAVTAPYPEPENEDVTAPYPMSESEEVTAPYPESENEDVTAPYPESENENVTAPYPMSEEEEDNEDDAAALFAMARSRFKEETEELLSRPEHQAPSTGKRKAATQQSNEWNKTQRILESKYQK